MKQLQYKFQLPDDAWDLLLSLKDGNAEYRDTNFEDIHEFTDSELFKSGLRGLQWFKDRNHGGTYSLMTILDGYNLVELDTECWHLTYRMTPFGKEIIEQNIDKQ